MRDYTDFIVGYCDKCGAMSTNGDLKSVCEECFYDEGKIASCGHPERYWKVEVNQDAWCVMCAVEKLAIERNIIESERDALLAKIETAKETLKFIGELPETNMGYWKIKAQEAYKQLEEK